MINFIRNKIRRNKFKSKTNQSEELTRRQVPVFPSYICFEITNACNLRCVQCLYRGGTTEHYQGKIGFVDVNLAKKVIDQLKENNAGVMLNGDGESLLHPDFHEIARYAVTQGLPNVYFNTNGMLMKPHFVDEFITYFKGSVSFSLDGFKDSHERLRRGSSYELVTSNIAYLQKAIEKTGAPIKITAAFCNYDQSEGEREEFITYWVERVDMVSVCEVYDKDYRMISNQINTPEKKRRVMCNVPWETFIVRWDGTVIPCSNCFSLGNTNDIVLGDAKKQLLKDIWHQKEADYLRRRTEKWDLNGTICEKCDRWNMYVLIKDEIKDGIIIKRSGVFTTYTKI